MTKFIFPVVALIGAMVLCLNGEIVVGGICLLVAGVTYSDALDSEKRDGD